MKGKQLLEILSETSWATVVKVTAFRRDRRILKGDYELRDICMSLRLSAWNNSAPARRIFMKFHI